MRQWIGELKDKLEKQYLCWYVSSKLYVGKESCEERIKEGDNELAVGSQIPRQKRNSSSRILITDPSFFTMRPAFRREYLLLYSSDDGDTDEIVKCDAFGQSIH